MDLFIDFKTHAISTRVEKNLKILSAQKHSFLRRLNSTELGKTHINLINVSG